MANKGSWTGLSCALTTIKGHGECVCHDKDIHGLVYLASVLSSKDTGESSIVDPEFSRYPFNSGRAHQRRGLREQKIHAHTLYHKKCKNIYARMQYITHTQTHRGKNTPTCSFYLYGQRNARRHTQRIQPCVCVCGISMNYVTHPLSVPGSTLNKLVFLHHSNLTLSYSDPVCHSFIV